MLEDVFVKMLSKGKYYCSYKAVTVSLIAVSSKEVSPSTFGDFVFPPFTDPPHNTQQSSFPFLKISNFCCLDVNMITQLLRKNTH